MCVQKQTRCLKVTIAEDLIRNYFWVIVINVTPVWKPRKYRSYNFIASMWEILINYPFKR